MCNCSKSCHTHTHTGALQLNQETVMLSLWSLSLSLSYSADLVHLYWSEAGTSEGTKSIVGGRLKVDSKVEVTHTHTHTQRIILFVSPFLTSPSPESGWLSLTHTRGASHRFLWSQVSKRTSGPTPSFSHSLLWVKWYVCLVTAYVTADIVYITLTSKGIYKM